MAKKPIGYVFYDGPSEIDGTPIIGIVTGFGRASNRKTGRMLQTYILRKDMTPIDAVQHGLDGAICGECPHRKQANGTRTCYVRLDHGPRIVYDAYVRQRYQDGPNSWARAIDAGDAIRDSGLKLRLGTYGDPAAIPWWVWQRIVPIAGWTGYTHQWRTCDPAMRDFCMASVDSPAEAAHAWGMGWRTFRVKPKGDRGRLMPKWGAAPEAQCPASEEAGKKVTCESCPLKCNGSRGGFNITIQAHGASGGRVGSA